MPDSFIQLPPDSSGKTLRTFQLPDGSHAEAVLLVDTTGQIVSSPESPKFSTLTQAAVAAGASATLSATAITVGTVGRLERVTVAASVPMKAELQTVAAGVPTTRDVVFTTDSNLTYAWTPTHKNFITQAGGASNFFRVVLTNLDTTDAADLYATLYWDETV